MSLIRTLTQFTRNQQDAEDAIQDAEVYRLLHPDKMQSDTIFKIKAFSVAKRNYAKNKKYVPVSYALIDNEKVGVDDDEHRDLKRARHEQTASDHLSRIMAAEECAQIRASLSPKKQKIFDILLAHGGHTWDAAAQSGIKVSNFKTLLYDIRHNRLKKVV